MPFARARSLLVLTFVALSACGPGSSSGDAATDADLDAARDAAPDAPALCSTDRDCDDGVFCNGAELCAPGAPAANARGCVPASQPACRSTQTCLESQRMCRTDCEREPDADGDGHRARECGGDDCDDADFNRTPGRAEVCDPRGHDEDCDTTTFGARDQDGDGALDALCCNTDAQGTNHCGSDCNDNDPLTGPFAHERCNGLDDDCDGQTDEGLRAVFYIDADGDGFGDPARPFMACAPPAGAVANDTDCDDTRPGSHPGAPETCDNADNDCDGMTDEGVAVSYHRDADGDGFGSADTSQSMTSCTPLAGFVANAGDCDDANAARNPATPEQCDLLPDNDCNPATNPFDQDRDGHDALACGGDDCIDAQAAAHPGAIESCDGVDDDCNGLLDGPGEDADEDGFASVLCGGMDCHDDNPEQKPGDPEVCNGEDDNCDGQTDEAGPMLCPSVAGVGVSCDSALKRCVVATCPAGRLDCDNDAADGCEVDPSSNAQNCGACGNYCGVAGSCRAGRCDSIVSVAVGFDYQCVLRSGGGVACRGSNSSGQLGAGLTIDPTAYSDTPVAVVGLTDAIALSAGDAHACAVRATGAVVCWGYNGRGQLGRGFTSAGENTPDLVSNLRNAVTVSAGSQHSCAIRADGTAVCWGANDYSQLGQPNFRITESDVPMAVPVLTNLRQIVASERNTYAVSNDDQAYGWGNNDETQIGLFEMGNYDTPNRILVTDPGTDAPLAVYAVASTREHACFRASDTNMYCIGNNARGEMSYPIGFLYFASPRIVTSGQPAAGIGAGDGFSCELTPGGTVQCWGTNALGQLGDGSGIDHTTASAPILNNGSQVVLGPQTGCVLRTNGRVACWGVVSEGGFLTTPADTNF